jgi:hypothetical protein
MEDQEKTQATGGHKTMRRAAIILHCAFAVYHLIWTLFLIHGNEYLLLVWNACFMVYNTVLVVKYITQEIKEKRKNVELEVKYRG